MATIEAALAEANRTYQREITRPRPPAGRDPIDPKSFRPELDDTLRG